MQNQQDYIQFGCSDPILLAPYEAAPGEGPPAIHVMDPDLYIKVRDILLARQFAIVPQVEEQESVNEPEPTAEQAEDASAAMEHIEAELKKYVDQILGALPSNDLVKASRILIEVVAYLGGDRPELKAIVEIFVKILRTHLKNIRTREERRR